MLDRAYQNAFLVIWQRSYAMPLGKTSMIMMGFTPLAWYAPCGTDRERFSSVRGPTTEADTLLSAPP
jgi:hypothetical protein